VSPHRLPLVVATDRPITRTCLACGRLFVFDPIEQKLFEARGHVAPFRCVGCRQLRRDAKNNRALATPGDDVQS
jgi:hypothetical protein